MVVVPGASVEVGTFVVASVVVGGTEDAAGAGVAVDAGAGPVVGADVPPGIDATAAGHGLCTIGGSMASRSQALPLTQ